MEGRHARVAFTLAVIGWAVASLVLLVYVLSFIVPDPSSHTAADGTLALVLTSPLYALAVLGVVVVVAVRRFDAGGGAAAAALVWSVAATVAGIVVSSGILTFAWYVASEGGAGARLFPTDPDGTTVLATYLREGATYYVYPFDLLPLVWLVSALVALGGSLLLMLRPAGRRTRGRSLTGASGAW